MKTIRPLKERILAELLGLEQRVTASGIIIQGENGKDRGIRPRWARVRLVGEGIDWVTPGQYVLVSHGRWSRQFECEHNGETMKLVHLDNKEVLAVSDADPMDDFVGVGIDTSPTMHRAEDFGAN
jgi:co-chaperonin GroES (HSP10)